MSIDGRPIRLGITFGYGTPGDPQLGYAAGGPGEALGSVVQVWAKAGRRSVTRGLSRASARHLAAELVKMADALDLWYPE